MLTQTEINRRLHHYNIYHNWSIFDDVPECQQIAVMYPDIMLPGSTPEEKKQMLIKLFGEL